MKDIDNFDKLTPAEVWNLCEDRECRKMYVGDKK